MNPFFVAFFLGLTYSFSLILPALSTPVPPDKLALKNLKSFSKPGHIQLSSHEKRNWQVNQPIEEVLTLIDLFPSSPSLSLQQIFILGNKTPESYSFKDFPLIFHLTLQQLVELTQIQDQKASTFPPLKIYLESFNLDTDKTLKTLLKEYPQIATSKLTNFPQNSPLTSLPPLLSLPLRDFPGWQTTPVNQIPGLTAVPLVKLAGINVSHPPQSISACQKTEFQIKSHPSSLSIIPAYLSELNFLPPGWARIDLIWSRHELPATRSISGSDHVGFNYPCTINCAHLEVVGNPSINGKQWISGNFQEVDGGWGCLKWVNGGKEPTGRHPYGSAFKLVVRELNEQTDTARADIFLRWCNQCGCTPYYLYANTLEIWHTGDVKWIGY